MSTSQFDPVQRVQPRPNRPPDQRTASSHSWWRAPFIGYAFSLVLVAGAFLIAGLDTLVDIQDYLIGIFFVLGTFLVGWIWGTHPALLAWIVGILCTDYLVIPPTHSFSFSLWPSLVSLLPFIAIQLLILWLIARQKAYQSQLLSAQQTVSRYAEQVGASNRKLEESNAQLERANQVKDQFLSMASHELRTPVTSIHGYIQLLLRRLKKERTRTPASLSLYDSLAKVDEQSRRLTILLNDLLDINRLRSGKMPLRLTRSDLRSLCQEVVKEQQLITGRKINLPVPPEPVVVDIDTERLAQVLNNLVSNACKYSPAETTILAETRQEPGRAILAVHNEGSGLSLEQQQRIFEPFYRSPEAQSGATPGWGLGLAISQEIVEHHHGQIWVESAEGKGATFFVALPLPQDELS